MTLNNFRAIYIVHQRSKRNSFPDVLYLQSTFTHMSMTIDSLRTIYSLVL